MRQCILCLKKSIQKIKFYNIDKTFKPNIPLFDSRKDILVYVNYFGILEDKQQEEILLNYKNVIFDNTQSFYTEPLANAYSVYSPHKFFGVADGGYLIGDYKKKDVILKRSNTLSSMEYLINTLCISTNDEYKNHLKNEARITEEGIMAMSDITQKILKSVDYIRIYRIRLENYKILFQELKAINELKPPENPSNPPMIYPLLIKDDMLRRYLVQKKIYVPQWWKCVLSHPYSNEWEKYLSQYLIPLPIDQRYSEQDMQYIAMVVKRFVNI